jgi:hypothetical protein
MVERPLSGEEGTRWKGRLGDGKTRRLGDGMGGPRPTVPASPYRR